MELRWIVVKRSLINLIQGPTLRMDADLEVQSNQNPTMTRRRLGLTLHALYLLSWSAGCVMASWGDMNGIFFIYLAALLSFLSTQVDASTSLVALRYFEPMDAERQKFAWLVIALFIAFCAFLIFIGWSPTRLMENPFLRIPIFTFLGLSPWLSLLLPILWLRFRHKDQ